MQALYFGLYRRLTLFCLTAQQSECIRCLATLPLNSLIDRATNIRFTLDFFQALFELSTVE